MNVENRLDILNREINVFISFMSKQALNDADLYLTFSLLNKVSKECYTQSRELLIDKGKEATFMHIDELIKRIKIDIVVVEETLQKGDKK